jgi:predicted MFS family arabinose efflux permease
VSFMIALALAVASVFLQERLMKDNRRHELPEFRPWVVWQWMKPDLRRLLMSDILVRFCEQIPFAFVIIWCMKEWNLSAVQFGWLTAIEMVTAMLIYLPVASQADRLSKKPFVVATFLFFAAFPLVLLNSHSFTAMAFAFFIRGMKEFGEPARKAMIMELSDPDKESATFGLYYLLRDTIVALAALGGAFLWMVSPAANLLTASACGLAAAAYFAIFGKDPVPFKKP